MTDRSVTKQLCNCLDNECHENLPAGWQCRKVASPGATFPGEDSVGLGAESSRPRGLLTSNERLYAKRDHYALSPHFERHMLALTSEELQSKSAIAAELAHRDAEIERLTLEFRLSSQQAAALRDERERLRAALLYWRNECSGREPSLSVFERMIDRSLSGDSSTSSDGSGRPTVPNDAVNATTSTGPGPSDETSVSIPRELAERLAWEHRDGSKLTVAINELRALLKSPEETSTDGWRCVTCGHENPKGVLRCQGPKCTVLVYSPGKPTNCPEPSAAAHPGSSPIGDANVGSTPTGATPRNTYVHADGSRQEIHLLGDSGLVCEKASAPQSLPMATISAICHEISGTCVYVLKDVPGACTIENCSAVRAYLGSPVLKATRDPPGSYRDATGELVLPQVPVRCINFPCQLRAGHTGPCDSSPNGRDEHG